MSILKANAWQRTNGVPVGTVLQVQQTLLTGDQSYTSNGTSPTDCTWQTVSNFNVSITPYSATSKILVIPTFKCAGNGSNPYWGGRITYNVAGGSYSVVPPIGAAKSGSNQAHFNISPMRADGSIYRMDSMNIINLLHSPATTSTLNYRLEVGGFLGVLYFGSPVNSGAADDNYWTEPYGITVMEIAG